METSAWIWTYFAPRELACRCGCREVEMDPGFMSKLQAIRSQFSKPMIVTSGYRCPAHNDRVSTTGRYGPHTTGHAADIRAYGTDALRLIELAIRIGMSGIGVSQKGARSRRFIHLDDLPDKHRQPRPWIWGY